nr:MAG TPA: hypothetical protein [Caudoviricetes sp.]DAY79511.1 MAG TPA: hypothetical protein [Caudoviricetes sp.]
MTASGRFFIAARAAFLLSPKNNKLSTQINLIVLVTKI